MAKSKAKSVRLDCETWDKLAWVADSCGERVNDFIRAAVEERLKRYSVPETTVLEGQERLWRDL